VNKKGSARDVILIVILVFAFSIGLFATHYMINESIDQILNNTEINSSSTTVDVFQSGKEVTQRFDYVVFGLFIGLVLALIVTGWFVGGNPIFMFIYFMIVTIATTISAVLANAWESFSQASVFGTNVTNFPITNHLLSYLPIYAAIIGLLGLIVMFAKPFMSQEE